MATNLNKVLNHILNPAGEGGPTDGQLLSRFVVARDEASFAALVRRHGPMVWRLCLRLLGHVHDAEDAFQATFLVLGRKAAAVVKRESVGSFLYGVAYRIAREAKTIDAKRRVHEKQVEEMPQHEVMPDEVQDWRPRLDHELNLLPDQYRAVIVACDLEGRSRKEAARHLGLSEGTVSSRLARGRCLLAKRLSRYGLSEAFEALLRRHGPMVLGVCRRVLRNSHDAEDAFQATFLVLTRKAGSLRSRELLANWLYGVAYRTAMKARAMSVKRRAKESQAGKLPRSDSSADEEMLAHLDRELNSLPDKYRVPVVLCELEGRSRKEVARLLGVPEGTLSSRLAQAKKILARRLSRYGTIAVAALLAEGAASASLPSALRASTIKAALTAGAVPVKVLALTEGVMKAMLLSKLKITACFGLLMLLTGIGATWLTYRATAQQPNQGVALASRSRTDELEALRLEIEALRKELRATRERVKTLEGEVGALKGQSGSRAGAMSPGGDAMSRMMQPMGSGGMRGKGSGPMMPGSMGGSPGYKGAGHEMRGGVRPADPVADAEAALKKLRQDPSDKQAAEELERALKLLKEQELRKPRPPADEEHRDGR
jgi:RNA polymerase sigma factor (sigma-70 family)